jgi:hypothetical protein
MLRPGGTLVRSDFLISRAWGVPYKPIFAKETRVIGSRTYFMEDFRQPSGSSRGKK